MPPQQAPRILIVHSDSAVAFLLAETLIGLGYGVEIGAGKQRLPELAEACAALPAILGRPDLIVADESVFEAEPVTALERLSHVPNIPKLIVLATSRYALRPQISELRLGEVMEKPFLLDALVGVIARMVGSPMRHYPGHAS